jgi:hypothetical protein
MRASSAFVSLTGGLGNQLFQLAEGLASGTNKLYILSSLGNPRTTDGKPDLLHFKLPKRCLPISKGDAPILIQKVAGYVLRKGVKKRSYENSKIVDAFIDIVANCILILYLKRFVVLRIGSGVGFAPIPTKDKQLLIGYFQHRFNIENPLVLSDLSKMEPVENPESLIKLIEEATRKKPIFVHYRLTDYLSEDAFGTLSEDYYSGALRHLKAEMREIWVFSDDPEMAKKRFPREFLERAIFLSEDELNPAQHLHLFRFGADYIIANSSFSWWGATLRMKARCTVIAPKPWFRQLEEPVGLIPEEWIRRHG